MPSKNTKFYSLILIIADFIVLLLAFTAAYILRVQYDPRPLVSQVGAFDYFFSFLAITPFWILIFAALGLYHANTYNRRLVEWGKIAIGSFIGILLVIGWQYATDSLLFPARLVAVYALISSFFLILITREALRVTRSLLFHFGRGTSRVLIIGDSAATRDIADSLSETHRSGYKVVAIAGPKKVIPPGLDVVRFSSVEVALEKIKELHISTIIQTDLYESSERNQRILGAAQARHISYSFIPGEAEFYAGKNTVDVF
jgi:FlaA1/EpsC-like NDP-sugar epimerase